MLLWALVAVCPAAFAGPGKPKAAPKAAPKAKASAAKPAAGKMVNGQYMMLDRLDSLRVWKILPRATPPQGEGC